MEKGKMIYEGKAKKVFETSDPDLCIVSYKDDATAFNGQKKGTIVGKGVVNNRMSNFCSSCLRRRGLRPILSRRLTTGRPSSKRSKLSRWRSLSEIRRQVAFLRGSAFPRVRR